MSLASRLLDGGGVSRPCFRNWRLCRRESGVATSLSSVEDSSGVRRTSPVSVETFAERSAGSLALLLALLAAAWACRTRGRRAVAFATCIAQFNVAKREVCVEIFSVEMLQSIAVPKFLGSRTCYTSYLINSGGMTLPPSHLSEFAFKAHCETPVAVQRTPPNFPVSAKKVMFATQGDSKVTDPHCPQKYIR